MPRRMIRQLNNVLKELRKEDSKLQYDLIKNIFSDPKLFAEIAKTESDLFDKISYLYHQGYITDRNKKTILDLMSSLTNQLKANSAETSKFLIVQLEEWISHESEYINYRPGPAGKGYVRLVELVKSK